MDKLEREILQISKEITVKFIETQRIMPSNFAEVFPAIHRTVQDTLLANHQRLLDSLHTEK